MSSAATTQKPSNGEKNTKTITLEKEITVQDSNGNIKSKTVEFNRLVENDKFVQAYVEGIKGLLDLDNKTDIRVLIALWDVAQWNTNKLYLIKSVKEDIAQKLGYSNSAIIDNSLGRLLKKGILVREKRSTYYIDPNLFFRGTKSNRRLAVKVVFNLKTK